MCGYSKGSVLAIDVGRAGAWAFIDKKKDIARVGDLVFNESYIHNIKKKSTKHKKDNKYILEFCKFFKLDSEKFLHVLISKSPTYILIEESKARAINGSSRNFNFGRYYQAIIDTVITYSKICRRYVSFVDVYLVNPRMWKAFFGDNLRCKKGAKRREKKEKARLFAISLYPSLSEELKRKKDHDRAEALLIANFFMNASISL